MTGKKLLLLAAAVLCLAGCSKGLKLQRTAPVSNYETWEIKDGKFFQDGKWYFLKIGKPLVAFANPDAVARLVEQLPTIKEKGYNCLELNCYWHHFDFDGDGTIDVSLEPLKTLVDTIYALGMYPCLSVETYAVGGGVMPKGFFERYPDAIAVDETGAYVSDTEYGFGSTVVSIFHEGYRNAAHEYIKNLASALDTRKILWFETTVEPQYMGGRKICYSENARREYNKWREACDIKDPASEMPTEFPIPEEFVRNEVWNLFRAQFLAKWINDDAAAYRSVAGENAYVAVDYLDASEDVQYLRVGNPEEFLRYLEAPNIIQVNWSWYFPTGTPNDKAYERVYKIKEETGRDWAVTEHMTFNGSDFIGFGDKLFDVLENTLHKGTRFGWEFVNLAANSKGFFSCYNDDWSPKSTIASVDEHWNEWLDKVEEIENAQ